MEDYLIYKNYKIARDRKYTETHEWIKVESGNRALVGISDYAQKKLKDIVMIEEPQIRSYKKGETITVIESIKSIGELYAPVDCAIIAWNEELSENPALISEDPYIQGWIIKIKIENMKQLEELLTPEEYLEIIKKEE